MQVQQITKNAIMQQEMDRTNETFSWKKKHHRPIYRCPVASFYLAIKILSFILNITEFALQRKNCRVIPWLSVFAVW